MTDAFNQHAYAWIDGSLSIFARIVDKDGTAAVQADIESVTFFTDDGTTTSAGESLTVANVVFDTLQTDAIWTRDALGFNFRHDVDDDVITDESLTYTLSYKLVYDNGFVDYISVTITPRNPHRGVA